MNQIVAASGEGAALLCLFQISILSAMLSLFFDYLMDNMPPFQWYLSQLSQLPENIAKPLGECLFCSGAWQYLFISIFLFNQPLWLSIFGLGINHLALKLLAFLRQKINL
jgi:hypothetical protein